MSDDGRLFTNRLFAPSWFTGEIVRIDVDAATPVTEVVASGFTQPSGAKFDSAGELYMSDLVTGEVWKLDLESGEHELIVRWVDGQVDTMPRGRGARSGHPGWPRNSLSTSSPLRNRKG